MTNFFCIVIYISMILIDQGTKEHSRNIIKDYIITEIRVIFLSKNLIYLAAINVHVKGMLENFLRPHLPFS